MAVSLSADVLSRYERFSLYNSPYVAHDRGCAIDLYPGPDIEIARSPVAGEVMDTKTVDAPPKPYAAEHDFLILIDCGEYIARTLHVDPAVEPGDTVDIGDSLGELVRAGFFAPWVSNHVHLGFREREANPYRASGSLPIVPDVRPRALPWDGSGTVIESGGTYAILDAPTHPAPGAFAGIAGSFLPDTSNAAADGGGNDGTSPRDATAEGSDASDVQDVVLDGGLSHYDGGGALPDAGGQREPSARDTPNALDAPESPGASESPTAIDGRISFLDTEIGVVNGRDVAWHSLSVCANDRPITGLSLFCARDRGFGAKLVCPDASFERGEAVTVSIHYSG
jgi:hypothetical protein